MVYLRLTKFCITYDALNVLIKVICAGFLLSEYLFIKLESHCLIQYFDEVCVILAVSV